MKRFFQTEWQCIRFSDIAITSTTELAGAEFYNAFYSALFKKYQHYDDLDLKWRQVKREAVDLIVSLVKPGAKILSVGCGLGYMEFCIQREYGNTFELHVSDYASSSLKWLSAELPQDRVHLADNANDLQTHEFDLIYFSAVDYAMPTAEVISLLGTYKQLLKPGGTCLMISASFIEEDQTPLDSMKLFVKETSKKVLAATGQYRPEYGQFWGWKRDRTEYRQLMSAAGFSTTSDDFIETANQKSYYIKGIIK
jgi:ubiquinone/menaquinone biosynthesis C-methylase UbiE